MLFFDGRWPIRAWPVLAENIRPNVYPRKSNFPSGTLQMRVFSSFTVSFSFPMISRSRCRAASAQDHEVVSIGHEASAEASLKPEHLPSQHEPAHVEIRQQW